MPHLGWLVDLLPRRLWKPGNLFMPFGHRLHFCSAPPARRSVRTIEWDGREIARGTNPFETPPDHPSRRGRAVVPELVDRLPASLWTPPGRAWLGGRIVFEVERIERSPSTVRVIDVFGRPGFLSGRAHR